MFNELALSTVMALLAVSIHGFGLLGLGRGLELYERRAGRSYVEGPLWRHALLTIAVVLGLFIVHGTEIWMYAALYKTIGAVPDLREAVYFSSISYGSIGYDEAGYIILARTAEQAEAFRENVALQRALGVDVSLISPDDLERGWPWIQRQGH